MHKLPGTQSDPIRRYLALLTKLMIMAVVAVLRFISLFPKVSMLTQLRRTTSWRQRTRRKEPLVFLLLIVLTLAAKYFLFPPGFRGTITKCEQGICGFWAFNGTNGGSFGRIGETLYGVNYLSEGPSKLLFFGSSAISVETVYKSQAQGSRMPGGPIEGAMEHYTGRRHGDDIKGTYVIYGSDGTIIAKGTWAGHIDTVGAAKAYEFAQYSNAPAQTLDQLHWLFLAALKGNAAAANDIGYYYATGGGVLDVDYSKALAFFRVAALEGSNDGKANLHRFYEFGFDKPYSDAAGRQASADGNNNAFTTTINEQPGFFDTLMGWVKSANSCYVTPACRARSVQQELLEQALEEEREDEEASER